MKSRRYNLGGEFDLSDGKPKKNAVSQAERKAYAEMVARKQRDRLIRRAERAGNRAERRGEEPIGYRDVGVVDTIQAGGPRNLESSVRGRTNSREPIYQTEYNLLSHAAATSPLDRYATKGLSGVRKGGEFHDPCNDGNEGAGASLACDAGLAKKVSKRREATKTTFLDVLLSRLKGKMMLPAGKTEAQRRYNPYNSEEMTRIVEEMDVPLRGVTLNSDQTSGFNINYQ